MKQLNKIYPWIEALRLYSVPSSLMPLLIGIAFSYCTYNHISALLAACTLIGGFSLHMGANVFNDYYDFTSQTDTDANFGSTNVLVAGSLKAPQMLMYGIGLSVLGMLLSIPITIARGIPVVILAILAVAGGYFYSAPPLRLKSRALGEPLLCLIMGPFIGGGAYYALTGGINAAILILSLPAGLLTSGILNVNNLRDRISDRKNNVFTLVNCVPFAIARYEYMVIILAAYATILLAIVLGIASLVYLIIFLSLPLAVKNIKAVNNSTEDNPASIAPIVKESAKLHFVFSVLLIISIIVRYKL